MTEKPKNKQNPYRKVMVYGCGFLLLMALVLGGLLLTLGKDFLAAQSLMGSDSTNCQPQGEYAFTLSGRIHTLKGNYNSNRQVFISGARVEIVSTELKRILESGAETDSCNSNYVQPIQVTSDPDGNFVFPNVRSAPWDEISIIVHADGYLPYEQTFYTKAENESSSWQLWPLLEPVPTQP